MTDWVEVCRVDEIDRESAIRIDVDGRTLAVYRSPEDEYFATDGLCTHGAAHLADGLVMDYTVECPKHHGSFDYRTGEALAPPVCVDLRCHEVRIVDGAVHVRLAD